MHFSFELSYTPFSITKSMKLFFLGISGTLMGNLALIAKELGHEVEGADAKVYPPMSDQLKKANISFLEGFTKENFREADKYIIGNVVSRGNELLEYILDADKNIESGPAWLYENILKDREVIAISGTHGKTSVTTMIAHGLNALDVNPGYLIAGVPLGAMNSFNLGSNKNFIIEADEYDTCYFDKNPKFLHYHPKLLVVNNIEFDHADIFNNIEQIEGRFIELMQSMNAESSVLINASGVRQKFLERINSTEIQCSVTEIKAGGKDFHEANLNISKAVIKIISNLQKDVDVFINFSGVKRRFETIFNNEKFTIIDDFAHHPTAIEKALEKVESEFKNVVLILEFGSNTMKRGLHNEEIKKILETRETYLVNVSKEQQVFFDNCTILEKSNLADLLIGRDSDHTAILMCSNKNFLGLQKDLVSLISSQTNK
ncbi:MAG: UDP-N-acetylmuramate:L-alanyl-gamma-D-glutamyl-meso-diaminopimelate ligase [SAR86 cluster bacterium]|uniref:UDP-N-acetylmuramate:L-alanyl-gamma-D-glutamyl-meso-diaminopimelate ligase n=1 Tax=SAR86 cluster bacterium TaxID=2030880 RepID=A0A520MWU7_9GAMM|nr:MAG: UDP-N-acetylmuramate:L-alanyl-gamma-D-glutamyl-meso-diaminopimelate ligase [SAR86 cluster bacterium]|tara:strand:- start:19371 stop:20663 length:1293 start_codon:yes stop_codon:yes gene_type:complete